MSECARPPLRPKYPRAHSLPRRINARPLFQRYVFRRDQLVGAARDHLRAPAFAGAVSFRLRVLAVVLDFVADL